MGEFSWRLLPKSNRVLFLFYAAALHKHRGISGWCRGACYAETQASPGHSRELEKKKHTGTETWPCQKRRFGELERQRMRSTAATCPRSCEPPQSLHTCWKHREGSRWSIHTSKAKCAVLQIPHWTKHSAADLAKATNGEPGNLWAPCAARAKSTTCREQSSNME